MISPGAVFRAVCAAALLLVATDATAQSIPPSQNLEMDHRTIEAARLADDERITLDGRLDEAIWLRAAPAKDFIQIDPRNGEPATEPTEVRIVFSRDAIYLGVTAFDSEPDKWLGFQRRRDEFLGSDDRFMWRIDTFLDERSGYFFEMNPSGLMADAVFNANGQNRCTCQMPHQPTPFRGPSASAKKISGEEFRSKQKYRISAAFWPHTGPQRGLIPNS